MLYVQLLSKYGNLRFELLYPLCAFRGVSLPGCGDSFDLALQSCHGLIVNTLRLIVGCGLNLRFFHLGLTVGDRSRLACAVDCSA